MDKEKQIMLKTGQVRQALNVLQKELRDLEDLLELDERATMLTLGPATKTNKGGPKP